MHRHVLKLLCIVLLMSSIGSQSSAAPAGFVDEVVPGLDDLNQPTAFAFAPNGDMFIATKPGQVHIYRNGALLASPALNLSSALCAQGERGLLGIAIDPQFTTNRYFYVYYTVNRANSCSTRTRATDPFNRVSRFVLGTNNQASGEVILVDGMPSPNTNHNAGDLHFGQDGYLYISVGDGGWDYDGRGEAGSNDAARDLHTLLGKILRITRDGEIPSTNPFQEDNSARCYDPAPGGNKSGFTSVGTICQETFAWGLRNPFRFAFDPNATTTRFFINDVGQGRSEEIDLGASGADYGWNCREGTLSNNTSGPCNPTPANMVPPVFEYRRNPTPTGQPSFFNGCASITGGAFVPNGIWPDAYDNTYLFADYVCGKIFLLTPNGSGGYTPSLFIDEIGGSSATHLGFGPDGALYYADLSDGDIRRVRYTGTANRPPTAAISASPTLGAAPLSVTLSAQGSSDPDAGNTIVEYRWAFGDGQTQVTTTPQVTHSYTSNGTFFASVRVKDNQGALSTNTAQVRIDVGNTAPQVSIVKPTTSDRFRVGQEFILQGSATDAEDGPLGAGRLSWEVRRHHGTHFHPYLSATGNNITLTTPPPEDLDAVTNSYLEIRLSATDSNGRTTTITRELRPQIVQLTVLSTPPGARLRVDGNTENNQVTAPATVASWPSFVLELEAPAQQVINGTNMIFCHWSQGGAASQNYTTPAQSGQIIAVYRQASGRCPTAATGRWMQYFPLIDNGRP